jgi:hypothetical protein
MLELFLECDFFARKKGERYECEECGLVLIVENPCECDGNRELICCQKPMSQLNPEAKGSVVRRRQKTPEKTKK